MRTILVVLCLLLPLSADAAPASGPTHAVYPTNGSLTLLNNIALNAAAGTRTFNLTRAQTKGYARLVLSKKRTRVAGTDLTMACTFSFDGGTTKVEYTTCSYGTGDGICTHVPVTWLDPDDASENQEWSVDILGRGDIECVVTSTSAGATDFLTVLGVLVTQ